MPRSILVIAVLAFASGALAQGQTDEAAEEVDFILRPTQDPDEPEEDIWNWDGEPELSLLESEIGPPLLGPTGEEEIGPPLAGPKEDEREARAPREREEEDPFAASGVRLGAFVIRPSIEIGVTATDNVTGVEGGPSAVGLVVSPAVNILSEDDRYKIEVDASGEAIFYDREQFNEQTGQARVAGRYDFTEQTSLSGEAGYDRSLESFDDDDTPTGAAERPVIDSFDAELAVKQRFGRFTTEVGGFADRTLYQDVPLVGGGTTSRKGEDNTEFGGRWRNGYELGGGVSPFVELSVGRRAFDQSVDANGFRRSSVWGELSGGLVIERGEKLSGEVSLGYHHEELEDDALPDIDAVLANATVLWSPTRLTEVEFDFSTDISTTSVPDESGSVLYSSLVTVSRRVTPRVRLAAGGGVDYEYSVGGDWEDVTFTGFAEASYAFSRRASVSARYTYERLESSEPGSDNDSHLVDVRLRLQR